MVTRPDRRAITWRGTSRPHWIFAVVALVGFATLASVGFWHDSGARAGIAVAVPLLTGVGIWIAPFARQGYRDAERADWLKRGRCPACGYSLRGNVSGVCPECGTRAVLGQRTTVTEDPPPTLGYAAPDRRPARRSRLAAVTTAAALAAWVLLLPAVRPVRGVLAGVFDFPTWGAVYGAAFLLSLLVAILSLGLGFVAWMRRPAGRVELLAVLVPVAYWTAFILMLKFGGL